jgi:hypothetical protein
MAAFQSILGVFGWKQPLERLPFEELLGRYAGEPGPVYEEFVKRLHRIIFQAALEYLTRGNHAVSQVGVEEMTTKVFEEFAPQFASGKAAMLLVDFAAAVRRVLDHQAFEKIAYRYYYLLPIYHLKDDLEKKLLAASYQRGIRPDLVEQLAGQFNMPAGQIQRSIEKANASLKAVIADDFTPWELSVFTEGYVR